MLEYDPSRRINLAEALQHPFLQNLPPDKKLSSKPREVRQSIDSIDVQWVHGLIIRRPLNPDI